jgi:hypothetical protein
MKILYIGKFMYPWSTENYVTHALRCLGASVEKRPFTRSLTPDVLQDRIRRSNPDVVLFSKPSKEWFPGFIEWCRERSIVTVVWMWDKYFGLNRRSSIPFTTSADLFFTTDGGHNREWQKEGANHQVLRQGIHFPDSGIWPFAPPGHCKHDVGFVGTPDSYPEREDLVRFLQSTYRSRFILHTRTRGLPLNRALARVKIIVGDSHPSPHYWSNRIYEITGRGGFFMHPITEGLDKEFTPGVHYIPFERGNWDRLREVIRYYIENDEEREIIRVKGYNHCRTNYTYHHRAAVLLERIRQFRQQKNNPSRIQLDLWPRSPETIEGPGGV